MTNQVKKGQYSTTRSQRVKLRGSLWGPDRFNCGSVMHVSDTVLESGMVEYPFRVPLQAYVLLFFVIMHRLAHPPRCADIFWADRSHKLLLCCWALGVVHHDTLIFIAPPPTPHHCADRRDRLSFRLSPSKCWVFIVILSVVLSFQSCAHYVVVTRVPNRKLFFHIFILFTLYRKSTYPHCHRANANLRWYRVSSTRIKHITLIYNYHLHPHMRVDDVNLGTCGTFCVLTNMHPIGTVTI